MAIFVRAADRERAWAFAGLSGCPAILATRLTYIRKASSRHGHVHDQPHHRHGHRALPAVGSVGGRKRSALRRKRYSLTTRRKARGVRETICSPATSTRPVAGPRVRIARSSSKRSGPRPSPPSWTARVLPMQLRASCGQVRRGGSGHPADCRPPHPCRSGCTDGRFRTTTYDRAPTFRTAISVAGGHDDAFPRASAPSGWSGARSSGCPAAVPVASPAPMTATTARSEKAAG